MIFEIWIPGSPVAWSRAGQHRLPDGRVITFDRKKQLSWKSTFIVAAQRLIADCGHTMPLFPHPIPVRLAVLVGAALPIGEHRKREPVAADWNVSSKDWDNLGKLVSDAGNQIVWTDDRQVVSARVEKLRMAQNDGAGVYVCVMPVPQLALDETCFYFDRARELARALPTMERRTG